MLGRYATIILLLLAASHSRADSVYGCSDLETLRDRAVVEGEQGTFFRVEPDLQMFHAFSRETVADLAALSRALAGQGTTLIYAHLPTKSLVMPNDLPPAAAKFGFDVDLATTLYDEDLRRLTEQKVVAPNLRRAMRAGADEPPSMFRTDYRMTSDGARRAARAVADAIAATDGFASLTKIHFATRSIGPLILPSEMRTALQRHCLVELPQVEAEGFETPRLQAGTTRATNTIFASGAGGAGPGTGNGRIALLGSEYSGEPAANLAGFLSEFTGLEVVEYSVTGGGSFAAISSYLTSREFAQSHPTYLVWANPVFDSLAAFGDQPMRELIDASAGNCPLDLPLLSGGGLDRISADLSVLDQGQSYTLLLDAEGSQASTARFDFLSGTGLTRTKQIFRHPDQARTGRFFMPMSGLWAEGAQLVEISLDVPLGPTIHVRACLQGGGEP